MSAIARLYQQLAEEGVTVQAPAATAATLGEVVLAGIVIGLTVLAAVIA